MVYLDKHPRSSRPTSHEFGFWQPLQCRCSSCLASIDQSTVRARYSYSALRGWSWQRTRRPRRPVRMYMHEYRWEIHSVSPTTNKRSFSTGCFLHRYGTDRTRLDVFFLNQFAFLRFFNLLGGYLCRCWWRYFMLSIVVSYFQWVIDVFHRCGHRSSRL